MANVAIVNVSGQNHEHDSAAIVVNHVALYQIRALIDELLAHHQESTQTGSVEVYATDGEGYTLFVVLASDTEIADFQPTYTRRGYLTSSV